MATKRCRVLPLSLCIAVCLTTSVAAWCQRTTKDVAVVGLGAPFVTVNGETFPAHESAPILTTGELLVPLDDLFAAIGGEVTAMPALSQFRITRGGHTLELMRGELAFLLDDQELGFMIAPVQVGEVVYVAARDIVTALGGEYVWDAATMTAELRIDVTGLGRNALKGTLVHIYRGATPYFLVKLEDSTDTVGKAAADHIEFYQSDPSGRAIPTTQDAIRKGDYVELSLDADGKVVRVLKTVSQVRGVVEGIEGGRLLLRDGQLFGLAADVRIEMKDGRETDLNFLRRGDEIALSVNPSDHTVLRIVVEAFAGGAAPRPGPDTPRIIVVEPDRYTGPVGQRASIHIRLRGTPMGSATADIGDRIRGIPLREVKTGDYQGRYVARPKDDVKDAPLAGRLTVAGREASVVYSDQVVTIDTKAPTFIGISPTDKQVIANPSPTIRVDYQDTDGSGVAADEFGLLLDGIDITRESKITATSAMYQAMRLAPGTHRIDVMIRDRAGNEATMQSTFTVRIGGHNKILSIRHDAARTLVARNMLTVTMETEEPGRSATFVIGDNWRRVPMGRLAGIAPAYRGKYVVRRGDSIRNAKITGHFVDKRGREYTMEATTLVSISTGLRLPTTLAITDPKDGDKIAEAAITVMGEAPPSRKVRVVVLYNLFGDHTLASQMVTTDPAGRWETKPIRLHDNLIALLASRFKIVAQLLDARGTPEDTKTISITTKQ